MSDEQVMSDEQPILTKQRDGIPVILGQETPVLNKLLNLFYKDTFIPKCADDFYYHDIVVGFRDTPEDGEYSEGLAEYCDDELSDFVGEMNEAIHGQMINEYGFYETLSDQSFEQLPELHANGKTEFLMLIAHNVFRFAFEKRYVKHIVLHDLETERKRRNNHESVILEIQRKIRNEPESTI